jgi:hypothetical protein
MDEDVFSCLSLNEAKPLGRIEPLHNTFFFHLYFLLELFALLLISSLDERREGAPTYRSQANVHDELTGGMFERSLTITWTLLILHSKP